MDPFTARSRVVEALTAIDTAHAVLRATSTDLVGNAFRIEVADRLETQSRVTLGLTYRVFGEIADPPDGPDDPGLPVGIKVKDLLRRRLRITAGEVTRRMKLAARIRPRRTLTGPARPPELPVLAAAVEDGALGEEHLQEVRKALDALPHHVSPANVALAERDLVGHARTQDAAFVTQVGKTLAEVYNPDGVFEDRDRQARRSMTLSKQGPDGMSRAVLNLTPEGRALVEAVNAAMRPGHHMPGFEGVVVDAGTDTRTAGQRMHDALLWGLRTALASGGLGTHRGVPVTVIATTTVADLEQAAQALQDPEVPMPAPARTGSGARLPMRDLIRMAAAGAVHYLAVFDDHTDLPLYLGRSKRLASVAQRILCYARDRGCTFPDCTVPGDRCEVHHATDWHDGSGGTDADNLFFACGGHHRGATQGVYTTTVTDNGRLAWSDGTQPPRVNRFHHPNELLGQHNADDP